MFQMQIAIPKTELRDITDVVCRYVKRETILNFTKKPFYFIRLFDETTKECSICVDGKLRTIPIQWVIFRIIAEERADTLAIQEFVRTLCSDKNVVVLRSVKMQVFEDVAFDCKPCYGYKFSVRFGSFPRHHVINPEEHYKNA